jgi:lysophospholipase L1-like esterase
MPASRGGQWFATWAASNYEIVRPVADSLVDRRPVYANRTVRQIVRTSIGGTSVRVRFTNEYGTQPLVIAAAHVALRDTGSAIKPSTDHPVTFGGRGSIVIRPGALIVSDPVPVALPQLSDLAITMLVQDSIRVVTRHALGNQSNYVSRGNYVAAATMPVDTTITAWLWLAGVDVVNPAATGVIVTIGNSITDGAQSTRNTNNRWPDELARRLLASNEPPKGIANAGISGNRVLTPGTGPSALARFDRDVLTQPGVTHVIVLEGINDIGSSVANRISADDIIYGLHQLADRAHERGLVIFGATLTPAGPRTPYTPELEAKRVAVNTWIRSSGVFDGVIDFDAVTRDPSDPTRMLPAYDSGDHLHPGDAGYKAMGDAIDLAIFRRTRR